MQNALQNHRREHEVSSDKKNENQAYAREPRKLDDFPSDQSPSCKTDHSGPELHQRVTGDKQNAALQFPIIIAQWDRNAREVVRVALDQYNGRHTINARVWYRDDGTLKPGKSGMTLALKHLPALADALGMAVERARDLGLLDNGGER